MGRACTFCRPRAVYGGLRAGAFCDPSKSAGGGRAAAILSVADLARPFGDIPVTFSLGTCRWVAILYIQLRLHSDSIAALPS